MLIQKLCKKQLISLLLFLLCSRSSIISLAFLINSPTLIHSCSFNGRLNGRLSGRLGGRLGGRLDGRLGGVYSGFSYIASTSWPRVEEIFWLISRIDWRALCMASILAYTTCICSLRRPRSIYILSFLGMRPRRDFI